MTKPQPIQKSAARKSVRRVVKAQMKIHKNGTASFHVRGYDFRWADMPISVNGYLFAPVRSEAADSKIPSMKVLPSL